MYTRCFRVSGFMLVMMLILGMLVMPVANIASASELAEEVDEAQPGKSEKGEHEEDVSETEAVSSEQDDESLDKGAQFEAGPAPDVELAAISIRYGQTRRGRITRTTRYIDYVFTARAGDRIDIRMNAVDRSLDPYLELYNSSGRRITFNDDGGSGLNARIRRSFNTGGRYVIRATAFGTTTGRYSLRLIGGSDSIVIRYGQTRSGNIRRGNGSVNYAFNARAGDRIDIRMNAIDRSLDPYLELYNSSGRRITFNDDGGSGLNARIQTRLTRGGRYTIRARSYSTTTGRYRLQLRLVSARASNTAAHAEADTESTTMQVVPEHTVYMPGVYR